MGICIAVKVRYNSFKLLAKVDHPQIAK